MTKPHGVIHFHALRSRTSQIPSTTNQNLGVLVDRLDCDDPDGRKAALTNIALICHERRGLEGGSTNHLLLLVEHTAKWSPHPSLQLESIDVLAHLGEEGRLRSLTLELRSQPARERLNAALRRLKTH